MIVILCEQFNMHDYVNAYHAPDFMFMVYINTLPSCLEIFRLNYCKFSNYFFMQTFENIISLIVPGDLVEG